MNNSESILLKLDKFVEKQIHDIPNLIIMHNEDGSYELYDSFIIVKKNNKFEVTKKTSYSNKNFFTLKNAVTWCIFEYRNKIIEANRVENLDRIISSIMGEIEVHKYLMKKTTDIDKKFVYLSKLSDSVHKKTIAFKELNNLITDSKYWQLEQFYKNNQI